MAINRSDGFFNRMKLHNFKRRIRNCVTMGALLLALAPLASVSAGVVVNWDGINNDYAGGANRTLSLGVTEVASNVWQRTYGHPTPITSVSGYTGAPIYGAGWFTSSDGSLTEFSNQRLRRNYSSGNVASTVQLEIGIKTEEKDGIVPTSTGGMLVFFKKEDFIGSGEGSAFGIGETSSLSVTITLMNQATLRFAVLNDGIWYVSGNSLTNETGEAWTLSHTALYTSQWAQWDPTGGEGGRLAGDPVTFDITASSFQDIEAVGLFSNFGDNASNKYFYMSAFSADFQPQAIPEPGSVSLLLLGVPLYWMVRLRRRRNASAPL